jgi:hypothetical protein
MKNEALARQVGLIAADPGVQAASKDDPVRALEMIKQQLSQIPDTDVYRKIVWFLGLAVLLSVVGIGVLAGFSRTIPESLTAVASASIGALAGAVALK